MEEESYVGKMITVFTRVKACLVAGVLIYSYSETSQGKASNVCCLRILLFWLNEDFVFSDVQVQGWSLVYPALGLWPLPT